MKTPIAVEGIAFRYWGYRKQALIERLTEAYPRYVHIKQLVATLYGNEVDGGPDEPEVIVRILVSQLRKLLPRYGLTIENRGRGRGGWAEYRLIPTGE